MTASTSFSHEQQQHFDAAKGLLDKEKLKSLLFRLTDIHSPTGSTQAACSMLVDHVRDTLSVDAKVLSMAGESAAGYARLKGQAAAQICFCMPLSILILRETTATYRGLVKMSPRTSFRMRK